MQEVLKLQTTAYRMQSSCVVAIVSERKAELKPQRKLQLHKVCTKFAPNMVSYIGIWNAVSVNRSNRPILEDGEHIVYVKDKVGVYQGQQKILNRQIGRLDLTNDRIIYVDEYSHIDCGVLWHH